jgi:hypothetical protein
LSQDTVLLSEMSASSAAAGSVSDAPVGIRAAAFLDSDDDEEEGEGSAKKAGKRRRVAVVSDDEEEEEAEAEKDIELGVAKEVMYDSDENVIEEEAPPPKKEQFKKLAGKRG